MKNKYLGIDIGGSFLKGAAIDIEENQAVGNIYRLVEKASLIRTPSCLGEHSSVTAFSDALACLINRLVPDTNLCGIGISTAGIVEYGGKRSAVPELLLANLCSKDIVVGISISGSAYYVQSALSLCPTDRRIQRIDARRIYNTNQTHE